MLRTTPEKTRSTCKGYFVISTATEDAVPYKLYSNIYLYGRILYSPANKQ